MTGNTKIPLRQRGLSLVELMIAMTLGILIVGGMGMLFVQNKTSYIQDEQVARMQEDARFALNMLVDDVELIGFWSDIHTPTAIATHADITGNAGCSGSINWIYVPQRPVVVFDHTGTSINSAFNCIADASRQANSDAIAINRVEGAQTTTLDAQTVYLKSNGASGVLMTSSMLDSTVTGTINWWQYKPTLYYIRNYAETAGDGIPTLCVLELSEDLATPTMTETCIARGVESLQVEYGIDTDVDGVANTYSSAPAATLLTDRLVSVRLHLLMRSQQPIAGYTNDKSYSLGNLDSYQPNDGYYRRVYTTTVLVRNTRNLRCIDIGCEEEI
ncbi:MAG TPA: PilW family protein [Gammaproteobacteria bacterium]